MSKKRRKKTELVTHDDHYSSILDSMVDLLESARRASARAVNAIMTATYWEIGRRIVELEQGGEERAEYGEQLVKKLAKDLSKRFGRGFGVVNLSYMRRFFLFWPTEKIFQTVSEKCSDPKFQTLSEKLETAPPKAGIAISPTVLAKLEAQAGTDLTAIQAIATYFPLPWSHYVKLLSLDDENARRFYEEEALRGGWSVRQLNRQINSQFYERTLLSKNKAAMLRKGAVPTADDLVTPQEEIKDPLVLEFLDLKDEYSETDLEQALIHHLEEFLLELGSDFTFVGRQRRLRIGRKWYRIDLLFFHRRLRCLVVIDLKIGEFDHADAGQMHLYLNYAAEHWTNEGENPPVGLILCAENDQALARYALDGLPNQVMAAEYKLALPDEATLIAELERTQQQFVRRHK
jgi:predicted nuclease of restriction endonuclease-like (RecB) superfamily